LEGCEKSFNRIQDGITSFTTAEAMGKIALSNFFDTVHGDAKALLSHARKAVKYGRGPTSLPSQKATGLEDADDAGLRKGGTAEIADRVSFKRPSSTGRTEGDKRLKRGEFVDDDPWDVDMEQ
jgi:hypothetical protein